MMRAALLFVAAALAGTRPALAQPEAGRFIQAVEPGRIVHIEPGEIQAMAPAAIASAAPAAMAVQETEREVRLQLPADILFDFDRASLRPSARPALEQAAAVMRARSRGLARIEGHTDSKGADGYNLRLSARRAEAVRRWLAAEGGLTDVRMATLAFAARRPVAPNARPDGSDDPDGRQKNRRVEIVFRK